jgi:hypothetical protein
MWRASRKEQGRRANVYGTTVLPAFPRDDMNRFPIFPLAELSERSIQRVPNNQRPWAFALLHAAACLAILGAVAVFSASALGLGGG